MPAARHTFAEAHALGEADGQACGLDSVGPRVRLEKSGAQCHRQQRPSIGSRSAYVGSSGAMLGCSAVIGGSALLGSTTALGSSAVLGSSSSVRKWGEH